MYIYTVQVAYNCHYCKRKLKKKRKKYAKKEVGKLKDIWINFFLRFTLYAIKTYFYLSAIIILILVVV